MKSNEAQKLAEKLRKVCISSWTSKEYQLPPLSKEEATIRSMEIMLFFWEAVSDLVEEEE